MVLIITIIQGIQRVINTKKREEEYDYETIESETNVFFLIMT